MKINPDLYIPGVNGVKENSSSKGAEGTGAFSRLLDEMSGAGKASGTGQASTVFGTSPLQAPVQTSEQSDALAAGGQALALLEHLSTILMDGDTSASRLGSVASALEDETGLLTDLKNSLDANDPLRGAIDAISVMSVVASMKIERGDFGI